MQHHQYTAETGRVILAPNSASGRRRHKGQMMAHLIDPAIEKTLCGLYQVATMPMLDESALVPNGVTTCGRCDRLEAKHYPQAG